VASGWQWHSFLCDIGAFIDHSLANRLLAALDSDDRQRLLANAELLELPGMRVLPEPLRNRH